MEWSIFTLPELGEHLQVFMNIYDIEKIIGCPDEKPKMPPVQGRICRFCKKAYPNVRFKKDAHIIPEFLGNRYLISDFECDNCNQKFGEFESDLANFVGIIKSVLQTKGKKNKVPNFGTLNNPITARRDNIMNLKNSIEIRKKNVDDKSILIDDSGKCFINYLKEPYRPFYIYKSFLKIALSCIDAKEENNYFEAFNILNNEYYNDSFLPLAMIFKSTISTNHGKSKPMLIIYKKRHRWLNYPMHCFVLYFQNISYQFFLPFHRLDKFVYRQGSVLPFSPPVSIKPFDIDTTCSISCIDLSSKEFKKDDVEELSFQFDINKANTKFDPLTGHAKTDKLKPDEIVAVVFCPHGTVSTPLFSQL